MTSAARMRIRGGRSLKSSLGARLLVLLACRTVLVVCRKGEKLGGGLVEGLLPKSTRAGRVLRTETAVPERLVVDRSEGHAKRKPQFPEVPGSNKSRGPFGTSGRADPGLQESVTVALHDHGEVQLLSLGQASLAQHAGRRPTRPGEHALLERRFQAMNHWQPVSAGDISAVTIYGDTIYAVGVDKLEVLNKNIYKQRLSTMTPYTNWTMIGFGYMSSIAIWGTPLGEEMYAVDNKTGMLWRQNVTTMSINISTWVLVSRYVLLSVAIHNDDIYGLAPDHQLYRHGLAGLATTDPWTLVSQTHLKALFFEGDAMYGLFPNSYIYNRSVLDLDDANGSTYWSQGVSGTDMQSIAVQGDTVYGVSPAHVVLRRPVRPNLKWTAVSEGPLMSVAIWLGIIYGVKSDGMVYKHRLSELSLASTWQPFSSGSVSSIGIQGKNIYGVGGDHKLYRQVLEDVTPASPWEEVGACCVQSVAVSDGSIFVVGLDSKVYTQAESLISPSSQWILATADGVADLAIRADVIYGVEAGRNYVQWQRLSEMRPDSLWSPSEFEGEPWSSPGIHYFISICVHNDILYAIGEDRHLYSKLIVAAPVYGYRNTHGNTHEQAITYRVPDLASSTPMSSSSTTPSTPTRQAVVADATVAPLFAPTTTDHATTESTTEHNAIGEQVKYLDYYNRPTVVRNIATRPSMWRAGLIVPASTFVSLGLRYHL